MGNCCSFKRGRLNGEIDPESGLQQQQQLKILKEDPDARGAGGAAGAAGGGPSKHHQSSGTEMKPMNDALRRTNAHKHHPKSSIANADFSLTAPDADHHSHHHHHHSSTDHHLYYTSKSSPTKTHQRQVSTERAGLGPQFKTPHSAIPPHMRNEGFQRMKHNSTSSLYIKSTLSTPDNDEILRCMANALLYHIERGIQTPQKNYEIFSEEKYPITKGKLDLKTTPTVDTIYRFIRDIFKAERLDPECGIMCLAYVERIITFSGVTINTTNWRRIVLSALILASKVWEDQSVWNVDFLPVFDNLTAADLNNLERQFLSLIQYNVSLTASIYAKYYFELRTFSKLDSSHFPLNPLDKLGARRLEDHSLASENRVKKFKRSASVDQINSSEPHTSRAVLN
ncbi:hypothetical protein SAMD00019534_032480 [Acytostelium subglobosum LB1]|uniref:hypothetical protein n=1 Tax=Acytostelium subglobosum LB1 TaxID=1410327 RepID=UPI0006449C97|nr:hypothetical protein SAMD00019534_032480 [Acytostelium subglobosum LB1]GAM20073.1 hypothetical protein SAMD00019534_032480 [Acytostelium subglobosum LB1]|eukprot:XP_012756835.1 hypothetical protein SAMD00019534_032480 [Acytostelium subglobosum LB1]